MKRVSSFTKEFQGVTSVELIGCGADYGSAWYGHGKMYEAAGIPAMTLDSEEWFHLNYFVKDVDHTLTIVFASKGNEAESRTKELIERLNQMERKFVLVTNDPELKAPFLFQTPMSETFLFQPMAAHAVPALIAGYLTEIRKEVYSRGFQGIWKEEEGMYSTTVSETVRFD